MHRSHTGLQAYPLDRKISMRLPRFHGPAVGSTKLLIGRAGGGGRADAAGADRIFPDWTPDSVRLRDPSTGLGLREHFDHVPVRVEDMKETDVLG
jgi:hypothetical protein